MNDITVVNGLTAGDLTVLTATALNYCSRDGNHLFDVVGCMTARHVLIDDNRTRVGT